MLKKANRIATYARAMMNIWVDLNRRFRMHMTSMTQKLQMNEIETKVKRFVINRIKWKIVKQ